MRHRDRTPLPEDVAADLAAIDAALAGGAVDPHHADLAALALELRDQRPRPDAGVTARLDERAAGGFAPRRSPATSSTRSRRLPALGVATALAAVTVAAVVIAGGGNGGTGGGDLARVEPATATATTTVDTPAVEPSTDSRSRDTVTPAPSDLAAKAAPPVSEAAPSAGQAAPAVTVPEPAGAPNRSVEKGAQLSLATTPAKLDDVVSGVVRTTDGLGGYVVSSSTESRGGAGGSAAFDLRVPSARLQTALARLSGLARLRSRNESSLDVTGRVVAARNRIDALQAERRGVLRQLAAATTAVETAQARERLHVVDVRIARAQAARAALRRRTAYSTIAVNIATERPSAGAVTGSSRWTPGDALRDAVRVLSVALGVALVALAALLPLSLLAAAAWGVWRVALTRRRHSTLDAAG